ncbi:MAG TPA: HIT domain-containing protein [Candidatus Saccharimonadales bacterium]|jgi:diadenosine tetraphosphate (Ap4A) HIT family hydrolase
MADPINCPFCHPQERVLEGNELAQVILSDPHKVPGHLLVMPRRHVEQPWDLTKDEITSIFDLIFDIEQKLIGKLGDGFDIRQSYRPFRPQNEIKLDHLVFHVLPRSNDDYIFKVAEQYESDLYAELDDMERDAVTDLLK